VKFSLAISSMFSCCRWRLLPRPAAGDLRIDRRQAQVSGGNSYFHILHSAFVPAAFESRVQERIDDSPGLSSGLVVLARQAKDIGVIVLPAPVPPLRHPRPARPARPHLVGGGCSWPMPVAQIRTPNSALCTATLCATAWGVIGVVARLAAGRPEVRHGSRRASPGAASAPP